MLTKYENVVHISDRPDHRGALLSRVLDEHESALKRFLRVRLVLQEERDDIVQDLFVRLAQVEGLVDKLSDNSGNTRSYLFSIANNLIIDMKRKQAVRKTDCHESYNEECSSTMHPTPEMIVSTQQQLGVMKNLLATMKPKYRQAFVMSRYKQSNYSEIATEMGVSVSTVEKYISAALSVLRKGLQNDGQ